VIDKKTQEIVVARLSKIEGQVRGIARMAEEPRLCVDILTQIAAAQSALKSVGDLIMDYHLDGCLEEILSLRNKTDKKRRFGELRQIFSQYCKFPSRQE
jgi:CsoR family transcriptional regulator, copper-sensing transcriptional repressor